MKYYYKNIPRLGNVAITRHAQDRLVNDGVTDEQVEDVLMHGHDRPDGNSVVWREKNRIRLVIETKPLVNSGAVVCFTGFRVKAQERSR